MLKTISKLGSELNISEKKTITGGCPPSCYSDRDCPRGWTCTPSGCEPM
ncbi:hypothetical protein [Dokdonia sp.]